MNASAIERGVELAAWAHSKRRPIAAPDIEERFAVSRATSHRWLQFLASAYHAELTPRPSDGRLSINPDLIHL